MQILMSLRLTHFNLLSAMLPRVRRRLTHGRIDSRGLNATGLLYAVHCVVRDDRVHAGSDA